MFPWILVIINLNFGAGHQAPAFLMPPSAALETELRWGSPGQAPFGQMADPSARIPVRTRSAALGILMSAVVPGTGEMFAGSWIKGAVFLGVEAALWAGYFSFSAHGRDWEDKFHGFADTHWSKERYYDWLAANPNFADTTHSLPSTKTQQYYEMIGKYDQFKAGWDDWNEGDDPLTPHRDYYEGIRHKSNQAFIRASYCTMAVLANHVLSAFDAAWTLNRYNRRVESKLRVSWQRGLEQWVPVLSLGVGW